MALSELLVVAVLAQAPETAPPKVTQVELRLPPETAPELAAEASSLVAISKGQELSLRLVRRTIERLMGTGRFADVVVFAEEREGGLELVIAASPKLKVGDVFVENETGSLSTRDVIAASKLERGSEYSPESMAEAAENVREAYRRKGHLHADIIPQASSVAGAVDVVLQVYEGEPTRLTGVSFAGQTGLPLQKLLDTLGLELSEVVDQDLIERGAERLRTLFRKEGYYRARIEAPSLGEDGRLSIPLRSGPRYTIQFRGNRRFPDSILEAVNAYDGTEALERGLVERMAQRLASFYRYRGFHDARVSGREAVSPDDRRALLVMDIDEGEVVVVRELEFTGNQAVKASELKDLLVQVMEATAQQPAKLTANFSDGLQVQGRVREPALFDVPAPAMETVLVEQAYRDAANAMRNLYRDRGYLEAKVELQPIVVSHRSAKVHFAITEGSRVLVEEVKYEGGPKGFPPAGGSKRLVGEPFSPRSIERLAQSLATDLARRGYVYAKVDGEWTIEHGSQAKLFFRITLGPEVTVGAVQVLGLKRTEEAVALRQVQVEQGKVLNPEDLLESQRNLMALGIFRTAEVKLRDPERVEPVKDVIVEVIEAPRVVFDWSFGYFLAEGVRLGGDLHIANLGGRAVSLESHLQGYYFGASLPAATGRVDVSNIPLYFLFGGRGNLSLQNRGLLARAIAAMLGARGENAASKAMRGADLGTRVDVVAERVFRQSYQFNRAAAVPGIDWSGRFDAGVKWARLKLTFLLQGELDFSDVQPVKQFTGEQQPLLRIDQERLRFAFGQFGLGTVRFAPTLDLRDDPVLPHRGIVVATSVEYTGSIFARERVGTEVIDSDVKFVKLSGQVSGYIPLGPSIVLALSGRAGNIFPVESDSKTPVVKRFFVGGASTLRGFPEDSMLPDDQRAEYHTQIAACDALANPAGCSPVAKNVRAGLYQPSPVAEIFALGKAELRLPFVGDFNVGLFFEAGNLWLDRTIAKFALRPVAGGGLRYLSPIGPLALDIGFNLQPDVVINESLFNIHFNVGVF